LKRNKYQESISKVTAPPDLKEKTRALLYRSVRNSELTVPKEKRALLTYPTDGLASCTLNETEDGIELFFESNGLKPAEKVLSKAIEEKYRFLINAADLDKLNTEYEISLSLSNLLIDINLRPLVMMRDAKHNNSIEFIEKYKALIGSVIQPRYKYEDYLSGGSDLYKKLKLLSDISALETIESIKEFLTREYINTIQKNQRIKQLVLKKYVIICNITIPILATLLITAGVFLWIALFQDIPFKNDVIYANSAFIAGEYVEAQRALSEYKVSNLSFESRYFLSRAYIITEALTDVQKEHILTGITLRTDSVIFDYWIFLGRLQFDEAIDIAQRLGDDELLLFAYLKYEVVVRNDTTISGEEKTALLNDITGKIDALQRDREEAADEASEAAESDAEAAETEAGESTTSEIDEDS